MDLFCVCQIDIGKHFGGNLRVCMLGGVKMEGVHDKWQHTDVQGTLDCMLQHPIGFMRRGHFQWCFICHMQMYSGIILAYLHMQESPLFLLSKCHQYLNACTSLNVQQLGWFQKGYLSREGILKIYSALVRPQLKKQTKVLAHTRRV